MLTKKRDQGSGRKGRIGSALWLAALLAVMAAPAMLEAQERDRARSRGDRAMMRFRAMAPRGMLGIQLSPRQIDADAQGAEVLGVIDDGAAAEAGLAEGDVITSLNGQRLLDPLSDAELEERVNTDRSVPSQRLMLLAGELEPGEEVTVEYLRDGEAASANLEVQEGRGWALLGFNEDDVEEMMEEVRERAREARVQVEELRRNARDLSGEWRDRQDSYVWFPEEGSAMGFMSGRASHGLSLVTLNPQLGRYFAAEAGALVTEAAEDNPLGLEGGDVILSIDGRTIDSAGDVRRILRSYEEGETVTLRIMRDQSELEIGGAVEDQARLRRGAVRGAPVGPVGRRIGAARRNPAQVAFWRAANRGPQLWRGARRR